MSRSGDDARTLRARHAGLADALDRAAADRPEGVARYAGRVYSGGAIPTAVPRVFLTHPLAVDVAETEGATPTLTPDATASVPVLVIGPGVPAAGDDLVARLVQGRWVAMRPGPAYIGPPPPSIPGCDCSPTPAVLTMTNSAPACDSGMFQPCTLRWQATPSGYLSLSLGNPCYLSDESFTDQLGDSYRYWFTCNAGQFQLTRVYLHSTFGSPFRDTTRYTWDVATTGNSCSPFALTAGIVYTGGDTACNGAVHVVDGT